MSRLPSRCLRLPATQVVIALLAVASASHALAASGALLDADAARHLLARTGFGPTGTEVQAFIGLTRGQAVDQLLRATRTYAVTPAPAWTQDPGPLRPANGPLATEDARKSFRQQQVHEGLDLRAWWLREMFVTPSPLTERMTLFWHSHFVSSQQKVKLALLMYRQNAMLRENALGSFRTLLHAAAKDPAMVIYLDGVQNRKGAPNENFAREVMELFTLGEGRYSEQDVREAARAFTGFSLDRETGRFMFRPALHDNGPKSVFGQTGPYDGDAVLDLLLARPETSEFIVAKLWREFVSPTPEEGEVRRIAQAFRRSDYDIKAALRGLLLCDAFWAPEQRGALIKSPVELVVGTLRTLELGPTEALPFALAAAGMSQNLFAPPNVKGWPGGETWINTNTLLARKQFLDRIANLRAPDGAGLAMSARPPVSSRGDAVVLEPSARNREASPGTTRSDSGSARIRSAASGAPIVRRDAPRRMNAVDDASSATIINAHVGFVVGSDQPAPTSEGGAMVISNEPKDSSGARADGPTPRAAPSNDDGGIRDRIATALARSARTLRFDSGAWVAEQSGASTAEKIANAERLLLALPAVTPDVAEVVAEREPAALVRAALLDPVYQLK